MELRLLYDLDGMRTFHAAEQGRDFPRPGHMYANSAEGFS